MLRHARFVMLSVSALSVLMLASACLWAQEDDPAGGPKPATPAKAARTYNPARRVPPYFGQIGLTPDQKEAVYAVREKYQGQIAELKRQIEELTAKEMAECEAVLTDAQRKLLEQRRASRRGGTSKASTPSKEAASSK